MIKQSRAPEQSYFKSNSLHGEAKRVRKCRKCISKPSVCLICLKLHYWRSDSICTSEKINETKKEKKNYLVIRFHASLVIKLPLISQDLAFYTRQKLNCFSPLFGTQACSLCRLLGRISAQPTIRTFSVFYKFRTDSEAEFGRRVPQATDGGAQMIFFLNQNNDVKIGRRFSQDEFSLHKVISASFKQSVKKIA